MIKLLKDFNEFSYNIFLYFATLFLILFIFNGVLDYLFSSVILFSSYLYFINFSSDSKLFN